MTISIKPGDTISQYRIVKELGKGALAEVYLATHTFLDIDRAIKVLHKDSPKITPDLFDSYCTRYKAEWRLAARVHHPNLIEVYDLFEHNGTLCAVVEYASGGTLEDKLQIGGRQTEDWVVEIMRDCAKGLLELHKLDNPSVVHCYVNPRTIVLDMNGRAKITNFGKARSNVAKLHKEQSQQRDPYDAKYQAPEVWRDKVDKTTDIYSLGCVAFRMLTGQDVVDARIHSPRQIEPSVPMWLDEIVAKCLSDDACFSKHDASKPSKRYFDMEQLLKALSEPYYLISNHFQEKLDTYFSLEELKSICHSLGIDHENIPSGTKSEFVRGMITYSQRHQNIGKLIEHLRTQRPMVEW